MPGMTEEDIGTEVEETVVVEDCGAVGCMIPVLDEGDDVLEGWDISVGWLVVVG